MISRVTHFGKKFEFSSANLGSHSNRYIMKVSSFSEFSSNIYYSQIDIQILLYIDIFALREDLICHFILTYCLRYQRDRVLFTAFLPPVPLLHSRGHNIQLKAIGSMGIIKRNVITNYISIYAQSIKYFAKQLYFQMRPSQIFVYALVFLIMNATLKY